MTEPATEARVLVVDDEYLIRELIRYGLTQAGYSVVVAEDGYAALNVLDDEQPDLIVSDVAMPGLTGIELVTRLRSRSRTASIPVLFLSGARVSEAEVEFGLRLGADDYMTKPFDMAELVERVRARLATRPTPASLIGEPVGGLRTAAEFSRSLVADVYEGGSAGVVAAVELADPTRLDLRMGQGTSAAILDQLTPMLSTVVGQEGMLGRTGSRFLLWIPGVGAEAAARTLGRLARTVARTTFIALDEGVHVTVCVGLVDVEAFPGGVPTQLDRADVAVAAARETRDLRPVEWEPTLERPRIRRRLVPRSWRTYVQFVVTLIVGLVVPFGIYVAADAMGFDLARVAYIVVVLAMVVTALSIWTEGILALHPVPMPATVSHEFPPATAIIAAYLPNEADTILDTLEAFLRIEYPNELQVILAYNSPVVLPIEQELRMLADRSPRIELLRVEESTSKAQNVNAAVVVARGEFIGIFDADHHPARDSFVRAWHWLSDEYDVVQGHCVVRNGQASWVARTVAVEFEAIYAVSHPGRARLHGFGIFGGSNGYWRAARLRETRMQGTMLTEDIDSSMRVMATGGRIASDPQLYSRELAPTTIVALWNQRMRWAQGWFQVSLRYVWRALRSRDLAARQRTGLIFLLGWREAYPWIALQMFPIVAFFALKSGGLSRLDWMVPLFIMTTAFVLSVGPGQALFAWRLAAPEIKVHKNWFWSYLWVSTLLYTEFKNTINRISQIKEVSRDRQWRVTPRTAPSAVDESAYTPR